MASGRLLINEHIYPKSVCNYDLKFKSYKGFYPLLKIKSLYKTEGNPYFNGIMSNNKSSITHNVYLFQSGHSFMYSHSLKNVSLFSGYLSAMGIRKNSGPYPENFHRDAQSQIFASPDIFCLGVVPVNKLPDTNLVPYKNLYRSRYRSNKIKTGTLISEIDLKTVTILVSEEKMSSRFMRDHYSNTLRRILMDEISDFENKGCRTEVVSDNYIRNFYTSPKKFTTNSLTEIMKIEEAVKKEVFSNLNTISLV